MAQQFIFYGRVSTSRQELGLPAQLELAKGYVNGVGGEIIEEFTEHASGKNDHRPELAKAIEACKRHHATLIVGKLDRLSRRVAFLFTLKEQLSAAGVEIIVANMPHVVGNTLMLSVFAGLAQEEREMISDRTKAALAVKKAQGVKLGRPKGVDTSKASAAAAAEHKASADLWAASVLPMIRLARNGGSTLMEIADSLNAQGQKTRRGAQWTATAVRRVLARDIK